MTQVGQRRFRLQGGPQGGHKEGLQGDHQRILHGVESSQMDTYKVIWVRSSQEWFQLNFKGKEITHQRRLQT